MTLLRSFFGRRGDDMTDRPGKDLFPSLPLEEWEDTKNTLHLFLQIVGKIRLYCFPRKNHWWHVPFYVSTHGLTTGPIPYGDTLFELEFDLINHNLVIKTGSGPTRFMALKGISVSEFYMALLTNLSDLHLNIKYQKPFPYDVPFSSEPFESDFVHASYDKRYVHNFWRILTQVDSVFQEFRGRFTGKSTPPHLFWHHMDLALTRFSGRTAPVREGAGLVEREAYSHEVISFGFWAGDENMRAPAFYGYAAPVPEGLFREPLAPDEAAWNETAGMAVMMYDSIRQADDPRGKIMEFLDSVYQAGAKCAGWDVDALEL